MFFSFCAMLCKVQLSSVRTRPKNHFFLFHKNIIICHIHFHEDIDKNVKNCFFNSIPLHFLSIPSCKSLLIFLFYFYLRRSRSPKTVSDNKLNSLETLGRLRVPKKPQDRARRRQEALLTVSGPSEGGPKGRNHKCYSRRGKMRSPGPHSILAQIHSGRLGQSVHPSSLSCFSPRCSSRSEE